MHHRFSVKESNKNTCPVCVNTLHARRFWIECDSCAQWYHGRCVGVYNKAAAKKLAFWNCYAKQCGGKGKPDRVFSENQKGRKLKENSGCSLTVPSHSKEGRKLNEDAFVSICICKRMPKSLERLVSFCKKCQKWFHKHCIRLVEKNGEMHCPDCSLETGEILEALIHQTPDLTLYEKNGENTANLILGEEDVGVLTVDELSGTMLNNANSPEISPLLLDVTSENNDTSDTEPTRGDESKEITTGNTVTGAVTQIGHENTNGNEILMGLDSEDSITKICCSAKDCSPETKDTVVNDKANNLAQNKDSMKKQFQTKRKALSLHPRFRQSKEHSSPVQVRPSYTQEEFNSIFGDDFQPPKMMRKN